MNFLVLSLIKAGIVAFVLLTTLAYLQWIERKVIAHIQLRVGPRRVGPHGLLQPLADVIKLLTKEDMLPSHVNKVFYLLAPFIAVFFALISISVIPFGTEVNIGPIHTAMQLTDLNIGVLFVLGLSGMGVYGVALAGFHTEYSSMKFAAFFMAEYANMVTVSCVATLLFLGGWQPLFPAEYGSRFVPSLIFIVGGLTCLYHG